MKDKINLITAMIIFGVLAAFCYASIVLMNKFLKDISAMDKTIAQLGIASIVLLPYTILTENVSIFTINTSSFILLFVLGIIHTGIAYLLYFSSIEKLKTQTVAVFSYIDPVVAILLSALILHESMDPPKILGAFLILGGALISEIFL